jgi:hypothetical protein
MCHCKLCHHAPLAHARTTHAEWPQNPFLLRALSTLSLRALFCGLGDLKQASPRKKFALFGRGAGGGVLAARGRAGDSRRGFARAAVVCHAMEWMEWMAIRARYALCTPLATTGAAVRRLERPWVCL